MLLDAARIERSTGLGRAEVAEAVRALTDRGAIARVGDLYLTCGEWNRLRDASHRLLDDYHRQHPLRLGMPREEWRSRLRLSGQEAGVIMDALAAAGELVEGGGWSSTHAADSPSGRGTLVRLPSHEPRLTPQQERAVAAVLARFEAEPFAPPVRGEVEAELGAELTSLLVERGTLVRVGEGMLFTRAAYDEAVHRLVDTLRADGTLTVAKARDILGTSRKYVLPLLEQLDERRVTLRRGDDRLLGPAAR